MTRRLRKGEQYHGLILANGGVMSYQHVTILSHKGRQDNSPFPVHDVLPEHLEYEDAPVFEFTADGPANIEVSSNTLGIACAMDFQC